MAKKKTGNASGKKKLAAKRKAGIRLKTARAIRARSARRRVRSKRVAEPEISSGSERSSLGSGPLSAQARRVKQGLGQNAAGQSGDLQGLSRAEDVDSESVEELIEEGQSFEADAVNGVENAADPDQGEVRVHGRPEDELPIEGPEDR